jgi:hypothetical protein
VVYAAQAICHDQHNWIARFHGQIHRGFVVGDWRKHTAGGFDEHKICVLLPSLKSAANLLPTNLSAFLACRYGRSQWCSKRLRANQANRKLRLCGPQEFLRVTVGIVNRVAAGHGLVCSDADASFGKLVEYLATQVRFADFGVGAQYSQTWAKVWLLSVI